MCPNIASKSNVRTRAATLVAFLALAVWGTAARASVVDVGTQACSVSYDGLLWYAVPAGAFSPIDVRQTTCPSTALSATMSPPRPAWAIPRGATQTRFVATSYQVAYVPDGMKSIHRTAVAHDIPMTWMIGAFEWVKLANLYRTYHFANGDDVQSGNAVSLVHSLQRNFPRWFVPVVSVEGAGRERDITGLQALGESAFWGIAWNSRGVDGTSDYGAPWGSYCADPASYKRPQPDGGCSLLAFEWTARDLTRAYASGREEYFSTDPDDLLLRARFAPDSAQTYVRAIVDAYAAAGETQPIVMMSQQESAENLNPGDEGILDALFGQAVADGMKIETLAQAAADARTFSAAPRAIAFPYIPGGVEIRSSILGGQKLYPATIDYHDAQSGMTFLAGHTLPTRVFRYADYPHSAFNVPLPTIPESETPQLTAASAEDGTLALSFRAPVALHYGIAIWSDPAVLRLTNPGAIAAGRAGVVVTFDLKPGPNQIVVRCSGCRATTFPYST
jgi:hypothetical protein